MSLHFFLTLCIAVRALWRPSCPFFMSRTYCLKITEMKKIVFAVMSAVVALGICSCQKSGENGGGGILETSWSKAVAEHSFLGQFPEYDYDFQGNYFEGSGYEQFQVVDRAGTQEKYDAYLTKLSSAGFVNDGESVTWEKTVDGAEYSASVNPLAGSTLIISYQVMN